MLAAAKQLRNEPHIIFLMVGGGKRFDELAQAVKEHELTSSFRFMPYQDQTTLPNSLAVADAHWLSLNPKLEGLLVPSKFYGIAAAGRLMIVIADDNGEIARLVQQHGCGIVVAPGDADALVDALRLLSHAPETVSEMGRRGEPCLTRILRGRKRSSDGADCSISSMNRPASQWRRLNNTIRIR